MKYTEIEILILPKGVEFDIYSPNEFFEDFIFDEINDESLENILTLINLKVCYSCLDLKDTSDDGIKKRCFAQLKLCYNKINMAYKVLPEPSNYIIACANHYILEFQKKILDRDFKKRIIQHNEYKVVEELAKSRISNNSTLTKYLFTVHEDEEDFIYRAKFFLHSLIAVLYEAGFCKNLPVSKFRSELKSISLYDFAESTTKEYIKNIFKLSKNNKNKQRIINFLKVTQNRLKGIVDRLNNTLDNSSGQSNRTVISKLTIKSLSTYLNPVKVAFDENLLDNTEFLSLFNVIDEDEMIEIDFYAKIVSVIDDILNRL